MRAAITLVAKLWLNGKRGHVFLAHVQEVGILVLQLLMSLK